jgi:hypothetical protein
MAARDTSRAVATPPSLRTMEARVCSQAKSDPRNSFTMR